MLAFQSRGRRWPLFLSCCLLAVPALPADQPATAPGIPLRFSVAIHVAQGCGAAISSAVIQQDIETQLRSAGLIVSTLHTAELSADVDCAVLPDRHISGMAVHECLNLSQMVSLPAQERRVTATTWRQCRSYTCPSGKCEPAMRSETRALVDAFSAYRSQSAAASAETPALRDQPAPRTAGDNGPGSRAIFYVLYIIACLAVLLKWELGRQPY